jgi:hypothetical protein
MINVVDNCVMYGERCCMRPYARNGSFNGSIHAIPGPGIVVGLDGTSLAWSLGFVELSRRWPFNRSRNSSLLLRPARLYEFMVGSSV